MTLQNPVGPDPYIVRTINPGNPAAGANFFENVPPNTRIEIISITATLTTDANVIDRLLLFHGFDATQAFCNSAPPFRQADSTTRTYFMGTATQNTDHASVFGFVFGSLSDKFILNSGDSTRITVQNIQATDALTNIIIRFKQWITEN